MNKGYAYKIHPWSAKGVVHVVRNIGNEPGNCTGIEKNIGEGTWIWMGVSTRSMHLELVWGVYT